MPRMSCICHAGAWCMRVSCGDEEQAPALHRGRHPARAGPAAQRGWHRLLAPLCRHAGRSRCRGSCGADTAAHRHRRRIFRIATRHAGSGKPAAGRAGAGPRSGRAAGGRSPGRASPRPSRVRILFRRSQRRCAGRGWRTRGIAVRAGAGRARGQRPAFHSTRPCRRLREAMPPAKGWGNPWSGAARARFALRPAPPLLLQDADGDVAHTLAQRVWLPLHAGPASLWGRDDGALRVDCCMVARLDDWMRLGRPAAGAGQVRGRAPRLARLDPSPAGHRCRRTRASGMAGAAGSMARRRATGSARHLVVRPRHGPAHLAGATPRHRRAGMGRGAAWRAIR